MQKSCIFLFLTLLLSLQAIPQSSKPLRLEFDTQGEETNFHLIPLAQQGFVLIHPKTIENQKTNYEFIHYSKIFSKQQLLNLNIAPSLYFKTYSISDSLLYILFAESPKSIKQNDAMLLKYDMKQHSIKTFNFTFASKSEVIKMFIANTSIAFLNYEKNAYSLQVLNPDSNKIISKELLNEKGYLIRTHYVNDNNSLNLLFKRKISRNQSEMILTSYYFRSDAIDSLVIQPTEGEVLNNSDFVYINDTSTLILGTYINDDEKSSNADNLNEEESTGIYASLYINKKQSFISFYNFVDMKSFYRYMNESEIISMKKKLARKSDKKYSMNYKLLLHDIQFFNNQYLLTFETYYPEYRTVSNNTYDYYGRLVPNTYTVFDGYRYQKAFVLSFNSAAKLLWENSMQLSTILEDERIEKTRLMPFPNEMLIATLNDGEINAKIIYSNEENNDFPSARIESNYKTDIITASSPEDLYYWYDNYFIACGYQQIKNNTLVEKNKRKVFYVNKIAYQ
ncbi:MAG: hypothetical protein WCH34_01860 [Bacteroidota bacterium]